MNQLNYAFTLPLLVTADGFESPDLDGVAIIQYTRDAEWSVSAIYLDGYNRKLPVGQRSVSGKIELDSSSEIYNLLYARLTAGRTADMIQYDVNEAVEQDRQPDPDRAYDEMRDRRMERV